ncbi:Na(+)-translocating NADH-quinone reductase subunit A, putative [Babesia ovis]|uniref:Na(+)-translocating NADH-quinone reductase subunit A, putative n=1 Tax=Babesia ovis TaxID=5869 RepID=A0A9W5WWF1_BABOV|nr:Na(+)-translocating NADH-quinone reductase subunit A, putative [Babesia ovis]
MCLWMLPASWDKKIVCRIIERVVYKHTLHQYLDVVELKWLLGFIGLNTTDEVGVGAVDQLHQSIELGHKLGADELTLGQFSAGNNDIVEQTLDNLVGRGVYAFNQFSGEDILVLEYKRLGVVLDSTNGVDHGEVQFGTNLSGRVLVVVLQLVVAGANQVLVSTTWGKALVLQQGQDGLSFGT